MSSAEECGMSRIANIQERIQRLDEIPTLPGLFRKIVAVIEDDRASVKDLASIISDDQAVTAKVLKLANSAYYGCFKQVSTVEQAVTVVGFNEVKSASLSITVFGKFSKKIPMGTLARFWVHSLASATAVNSMGGRGQELGVEKIYVGALLHDIGKLVLHVVLGEDYLSLLNQAASESCPLLEMEKRVLGCHHAQVGEWLAQKWHFPQDLKEVIAFHHHPFRGGLLQPKTVATIYLANHLAKRFVGIGSLESASDPTLDQVLQVLRVNGEEMEQMGEYIKSRERMVTEMTSIIS
jgi:putative nucleotidyltransferase with HDIG domain